MREVFHKRKAEHHSDPGSHQRIAPEIIEQLEGIPIRSQPGERRRDALKSDLRNLIPENSDAVRQKHLHGKADRQKNQPILKQGRRHFSSAELSGKAIPIAHNRPLRHLREHREIRSCLKKRRLPSNFPPVQIRLIGDHLKDIEGKSHRKRKRKRKHLCGRQKSKNLAEDKNRRIQRSHRSKSRLLPGIPDCAANRIVDHRQRNQKNQCKKSSARVKHKASQKQNSIPVLSGGQVKYTQKNWQKNSKELPV